MISATNFTDDFRAAMISAGLGGAGAIAIVADGQIHRFSVDGDKPNAKTAWYLLHGDRLPAGAFGDWKRGINNTWCAKSEKGLTDEEKTRMEKAKQEREQALERERTKAREKARHLWNQAKPANGEHPYLVKKGVKPFGIRIHQEALVVPLQDGDGIIHSLQFINKDGEKRFLFFGAVKGNYYLLGEPTDTLYLCEGFATGATIHEATDCGVIVAFNAGNLLPVAQAIRIKHPDKKLIIAADNDQFTEGNPGVKAATEAAKQVGAQLVIPQFVNIATGDKPTDFNDLARYEGIEEVKRQLLKSQLIGNTQDNQEEKSRRSQVTALLDLLAEVEFFHDDRKRGYARFLNNGHYEVWSLESDGFRNWLSHTYWKFYKKALNKNSLTDALSIMQGKAVYDGALHPVATRVGAIGESVFINLANERWEVIEVTKNSYKVLPDSPFRFKVTPGMLPLPTPSFGVKNFKDAVNLLWRHANIPQSARMLVIAWLIECWRPDTNFPILVLTGQQGSCKSTTQNILRGLIDPNTSNLRSAPKKPEDFVIAAANNWLVSFNNLSSLTPQAQDDMCCIATGGGFATRKYYTNGEEEVLDIKRPIVLNGINDLATQQDLIDRCITVELPTIKEDERKTDKELSELFDEDRPIILAGLLEAFGRVLNVLSSIKLVERPRMADYGLLGTALEKVFGWPEGSFMEAYKANRDEGVIQAMENSSAIVALLNFMDKQQHFEGSYGTLYDILTKNFKPEMSGWPKSPKGLSGILKRQAPALKVAGFDISFNGVRKGDGYHLEIIKRSAKYPKTSTGSTGSTAAQQYKASGAVLSEHVQLTSTALGAQVHSSTPDKSRVSVLNELNELENDYLGNMQRVVL